MNYYAKLAEEKRNGNFFLERLKTKSFRSADELERAIKSYVAGGRVISDDADGFTVEAIDDDGKHTYKIYLREDGGTSERVTVEKVVKLNSKENSMNYYETIIQEKKKTKQEKINSLSEKAKKIISKAVAEARFDYRTAIDFAVADLKAEKEWAWTSQAEVSQMVQRLIKNRLDFNFNSKEEKTNSYKYKDSTGEIYTIEKAPNGKYFYKQEGMGGSVGPFSSFEEAERMLKKHRSTIYPINSKEEKGYYAKLAEEKAEKKNFGDETLIEKKSFGEYWYSIHQTKNKMILRVYTPYGMYYIDDIRDLADGRNEAQRTIDIVKKAGKYV